MLFTLNRQCGVDWCRDDFNIFEQIGQILKLIVFHYEVNSTKTLARLKKLSLTNKHPSRNRS